MFRPVHCMRLITQPEGLGLKKPKIIAMATASKSTVRIQIDVEQEVADAIDDLGSLLQFKSRRETISTAVSLLEWAAWETHTGHKIGSAKDGQYTDLLIPALARLNRKDQWGQMRDTQNRKSSAAHVPKSLSHA